MGRIKDIMMERDERPDMPDPALANKFVCTNHFDNKYINAFISSHGINGVCSYCHRAGKVCDMETLGEHLSSHIQQYYTPLDNADLPLASSFYDDDDEVIPGFRRIGSYIAPTENDYYDSKEEMIDGFGLYTDEDELNEDIESIFSTEEWIYKDFYEEDKSTRYSNLWDLFVDVVTNRRRYTFLADPQLSASGGDLDTIDDNILTILQEVILQQGLCVELEKGTTLYRARKVDDVNQAYGFNDITAAPDSSAPSNRMSPAGISMLYASFDKDTPLRECVGCSNSSIILGTFHTIRPLKVIDLTQIPECSFWMDHWQENRFLHHFNENITKKLNCDDKNHLQYIPTQIFTEYLRYMFTDGKRNHVDGLIYGSSKSEKKNIVLFCNQKESVNFVERNVRIDIVKQE